MNNSKSIELRPVSKEEVDRILNGEMIELSNAACGSAGCSSGSGSGCGSAGCGGCGCGDEDDGKILPFIKHYTPSSYRGNGLDLNFTGHVYCEYTKYGTSVSLVSVKYLFYVQGSYRGDQSVYGERSVDGKALGNRDNAKVKIPFTIRTVLGETKTYYVNFDADFDLAYNLNSGQVEGDGTMTATLSEQ